LVYPVSKLKTVDYLFKYKGIIMDVEDVYRYLYFKRDKLPYFLYQKIENLESINFSNSSYILD